MTAEQIEIYRRAIAPLQESLAAAKAVRQEVFQWIKGGVFPLECAPETARPNPRQARGPVFLRAANPLFLRRCVAGSAQPGEKIVKHVRLVLAEKPRPERVGSDFRRRIKSAVGLRPVMTRGAVGLVMHGPV